MALLTGMTEDGREVPVQVDAAGRLVAEGLPGPPGSQGPDGPAGPAGDPSEFAVGSDAAPGLHPVGDPDTGIYSPAPNEMAVAVAGRSAVRITSTGDLFVNPLPDTGTGVRLWAGGQITSGVTTPSHIAEFRSQRAEDHDVALTNSVGYARFGVRTSGAAFAGSFSSGKELELWAGGFQRAQIEAGGDFHSYASVTADGAISAAGVVSLVYADNAAALAAGLTPGDFYRQPDGTLMIAF